MRLFTLSVPGPVVIHGVPLELDPLSREESPA